MKRSIKLNHKKAQILILLSSVFATLMLLFSFSKADPEPENDNLYCKISYQSCFRNDTCSLKINNVIVFRNKVLLSEKNYGIAFMEVEIYKQGKKYFLKRDTKLIKVHFKNPNELNIDSEINEKNEKMKIYIFNGKFIGFKKCFGKLEVVQSKIPFFYD
jgi:hypothetical protein